MILKWTESIESEHELNGFIFVIRSVILKKKLYLK